jgi:hypothetical protein
MQPAMMLARRPNTVFNYPSETRFRATSPKFEASVQNLGIDVDSVVHRRSNPLRRRHGSSLVFNRDRRKAVGPLILRQFHSSGSTRSNSPPT